MPNPYTVTIGASNKTLDIRAGSLRFTESLQSRGSINFKLVNDDVSYTPSKWAAVTVEKDGEVIAKGVVTRPPYGGVGGSTVVAIEATTTCGDLKTHWEKRRLTATIAEGTMKAALQDAALADIYTDQGFTLDQPDDGPTVGPFEFVNVTLFDAIRAIADDCDPIRVIELDLDDLEFRLIEPGDTAAPWDVVEDADGVCEDVDGDLTVEPNGNLEANSVIVQAGENRKVGVLDTFTGDGSTDTFPLTYPIAGLVPGTATGVVGNTFVRVDGVRESLGSIGSGFVWEYDGSDLDAPTVTRTTGAPAMSAAIEVPYQAQFPISVRAFDQDSIDDIGQIDFVVPAPNLYSKAEAQRIADQTLAAMLGGPRIVRYPTTRAGLRVGMTQHIDSSIRGIDADCLITEITAEDRGGDCLVYLIQAVEGGLPPKPWQDSIRDVGSGTGTGRPSPGSTSGDTDVVGGNGNGFSIPPDDTWVLVNVMQQIGAFPGLRWLYRVLANIALGIPAAPSVADTGSGSYAATARHYYIQLLTKTGSVIDAISEVGAGTAFTPVGTGTAARVTKPAHGTATHWRVIASADSGATRFNISGDLAVGTTTYDDSVVPASYADVGESPRAAGLYSGMAQLLVTSLADNPRESHISARSETSVVEVAAFEGGTGDRYTGEVSFSTRYLNGQYVATSEVVSFVTSASQTGLSPTGNGHIAFEIYPEQTVGAPADFSTLRDYRCEPEGYFNLQERDLGASWGGRGLVMARNSNGSGAPAFIALQCADSAYNFIWIDNSDLARISTGGNPQADGSPSITSGTILGTQSCRAEFKHLIERMRADGRALRLIKGTNVHRFRYKNDAYGGTEFVGITAEESPAFAMDNGRVFNPVSAFGWLVLAIQELATPWPVRLWRRVRSRVLVRAA